MTWLDDYINISPPSSTGWQEVDLSGHGIPANATILVFAAYASSPQLHGIRKVGSTNNFTTTVYAQKGCLVGQVNAYSKIELYVDNTYSVYYLYAYLSPSEATIFTDAINHTPAGTGWTDTDCSSDVPVGTEFAIFEYTGFSASQGVDFRQHGSTDEKYQAYSNEHGHVIVGLDVNRHCDVYVEAVVANSIQLVGYLHGTAIANSYNFMIGTAGSYVDIDLSSDPSIPANATDAIVLVSTNSNSNTTWSLRKKGDTNNFYSSSSYGCNGCTIVPLDGSHKLEGKTGIINRMKFWVMGYLLGAVAPVAAFHADTVTGGDPLTVNFTDDSTNTPTSWDWDWGDGTAHGTTQNPSHEYINAGVYTVTLTATNSGGSDEEIKVDYITVMGTNHCSVSTTLPFFIVQGGGFYTIITDTAFPAYRLHGTIESETRAIVASMPSYTLSATLKGGGVIGISVSLPPYRLSGAFTVPVSIVTSLPKYTLSGYISSQPIITVETSLPAYELVSEFLSGNMLSVVADLPQWILEGNILSGNLSYVKASLPKFTLSSTIAVRLDNTITVNIALPGYILDAGIGKILSELYDTYVLNTKNMALTKYTNYGYNSMTYFRGKYIGSKIGLDADHSGIYLLEGTHDDVDIVLIDDVPTSVPFEIDAYLATGYLDFGVNKLVNIISAFLKMKGDAGNYKISLVTDDGITVQYPFTTTLTTLVNFRKKFGQGKKGTQWKLIFENINGEDFEIVDILLETGVMSRRS